MDDRVRELRVGKTVLDREVGEVSVAGQPVRIKLARLGGAVVNVSVEYEDVRRHSTRFVVRPGHVKGPLERIVSRNRRYSVIEKVDRVVAAVVKRLNPRPETL